VRPHCAETSSVEHRTFATMDSFRSLLSHLGVGATSGAGATPSAPKREAGLPPKAIIFSKDAAGSRVELGRGAFGKTYAATVYGQEVAVKQLTLAEFSTADARVFWNEVQLQTSLQHPHILRIVGVSIDASDAHRPFVCMIMPRMVRNLAAALHGSESGEGGLDTAAGAAGAASTAPATARDAHALPPLEQRISWMLQIALGLQYMHGRATPIVHADIKPGNVLLDAENRVKLADFGESKARERAAGRSGLSVTFAPTTLRHERGTLQYMAPELIQLDPRVPPAGALSTASDVYSLGIMLWQVATGRQPYEDLSPAIDLRYHVHSGQRPPVAGPDALPPGLPADFGDFLSALWHPVASERLTAPQVVLYLAAAFPAAARRLAPTLPDARELPLPAEFLLFHAGERVQWRAASGDARVLIGLLERYGGEDARIAALCCGALLHAGAAAVAALTAAHVSLLWGLLDRVAFRSAGAVVALACVSARTQLSGDQLRALMALPRIELLVSLLSLHAGDPPIAVAVSALLAKVAVLTDSPWPPAAALAACCAAMKAAPADLACAAALCVAAEALVNRLAAAAGDAVDLTTSALLPLVLIWRAHAGCDGETQGVMSRAVATLAAVWAARTATEAEDAARVSALRALAAEAGLAVLQHHAGNQRVVLCAYRALESFCSGPAADGGSLLTLPADATAVLLTPLSGDPSSEVWYAATCAIYSLAQRAGPQALKPEPVLQSMANVLLTRQGLAASCELERAQLVAALRLASAVGCGRRSFVASGAAKALAVLWFRHLSCGDVCQQAARCVSDLYAADASADVTTALEADATLKSTFAGHAAAALDMHAASAAVAAALSETLGLLADSAAIRTIAGGDQFRTLIATLASMPLADERDAAAAKHIGGLLLAVARSGAEAEAALLRALALAPASPTTQALADAVVASMGEAELVRVAEQLLSLSGGDTAASRSSFSRATSAGCLDRSVTAATTSDGSTPHASASAAAASSPPDVSSLHLAVCWALQCARSSRPSYFTMAFAKPAVWRLLQASLGSDSPLLVAAAARALQCLTLYQRRRTPEEDAVPIEDVAVAALRRHGSDASAAAACTAAIANLCLCPTGCAQLLAAGALDAVALAAEQHCSDPGFADAACCVIANASLQPGNDSSAVLTAGRAPALLLSLVSVNAGHAGVAATGLQALRSVAALQSAREAVAACADLACIGDLLRRHVNDSRVASAACAAIQLLAEHAGCRACLALVAIAPLAALIRSRSVSAPHLADAAQATICSLVGGVLAVPPPPPTTIAAAPTAASSVAPAGAGVGPSFGAVGAPGSGSSDGAVDPRTPAAVPCCSGLSQRERAGLPAGSVAAFSLFPPAVPASAATAALRPQGRTAALSSVTGASLTPAFAAPACSPALPVIPPLPARSQPTWFGGDPSAAKNPRRTLKLVLSGDAGVGKTPLLHRLRTGEFYAAGGSTCSYESSTLCVSLEGEPARDSGRDTGREGARETVRLAIWDTAGVDGAAAALLRAPYEQAAGCLLCFDVTERSSFVALERRLLRLQEWSGPHVPAVVAGLKTDRAASRKVPPEEARAWAAERGLPYVEASSFSGEGVWEVLWTLVHVANAAARGRESTRIQPAAAAAAAIAATLGAAASAGEDGRAAAAALSAQFGAAASAVAGRKATATAAAITALEGGKGSAASAASAAAAAVTGFLGAVTSARSGTGGNGGKLGSGATGDGGKLGSGATGDGGKLGSGATGDGGKLGSGAGASAGAVAPASARADAGTAAEVAVGASAAAPSLEVTPGLSPH